MQQSNNNDQKVNKFSDEVLLNMWSSKVKIGIIDCPRFINLENIIYISSRLHQNSNIDLLDLEDRQKISPAIFPIQEYALMCTKFFKKYAKDKKQFNKDTLSEITQEFQNLFLHCIDRVAFYYFDVNKNDFKTRINFMDDLCRFVAKQNATHNNIFLNKVKKSVAMKTYLNKYDIDTLKYCDYEKLLPDYNEGPKDTLFWDFSLELLQKVGMNESLIAVNVIISFISQSIEALQIEPTLKLFFE